MNNVVKERIENIESLDIDIKKLYDKHLKLAKEVTHIERYARYSNSAAIYHRQLKKEKLKSKESLIAKIDLKTKLEQTNNSLS